MSLSIFTFPTGAAGIAQAIAFVNAQFLPILSSLTFAVSTPAPVSAPTAGSGAVTLGSFTTIADVTSALNAAASSGGNSILIWVVPDSGRSGRVFDATFDASFG